MLFVQIRSSIHNPNKLYLDKDVRDLEEWSLENIPIYSPYEVPRDYVFDESGDYNAYNLIVWAKGACCLEHTDSCVNYKVNTDKSIFDLTYYIDDIPGFETTSELFDDWGASRRGHDYYLYINVYTVHEELAKRYTTFVEKWIKENSCFYEIMDESAEIERPLCHSIYDKGYRTSTDSIIAFEKDPSSKLINASWDIDFPEYEGSGSEGYILLEVALVAIPLLLNYFAIGDKEKKAIKTYHRHMKLIYDKLSDRFDYYGTITLPAYGPLSYDEYGNPEYRITLKDKDTGKPTLVYIATIKKKNLWKERCSVRLEKKFEP